MADDQVERASERRVATVMFADISGFTAMSERLDPEEVTAVVNRCFEALEAAVRSHGGFVDKYIGDCIMALFGVPMAIEHAPRQALNAAANIPSERQSSNTPSREPPSRNSVSNHSARSKAAEFKRASLAVKF